MKLYITSLFSLRMFDTSVLSNAVEITRRTQEEAIEITERWKRKPDATVMDVMRSKVIAAHVSETSGGRLKLSGSLDMFTLTKDDAILLAHYVGPRLFKGTPHLPEGGRIDWYTISLLEKVEA